MKGRSIATLSLGAMLSMELASAAPAEKEGAIVHRKVAVAAVNDDWTRAGVMLEPGLLVVVMVEGEMRSSSETKEAIGPEGSRGTGRLDAKIGSSLPLEIGESRAFRAKDRGVLKFRIQDTKYEDNSGGYIVNVLVFPPKLIPEARPVSEDEQ